MNFAYPVKITKKDNFYIVVFRDLPMDVPIQGETVEDATNKAGVYLQNVITSLMKDDLDIPDASDILQGESWVEISASFFAKTAFYTAFRTSDLTKAQLAKKLDVSEEVIIQMLDAEHQTRLTMLESALNILGYRLSMLLQQ